MEQKDVGGAVIELKNLLQQNPDNATGRHLLGKALLDAGDLAGAEIELRRAWERARRATLAPLLAQTLLLSGQSRKLISEFADQSLADPAAMSTLQQQLAMAYLAQGNVTEAKAAAVRALQLSRTRRTPSSSARIKLAGGFPDEALEALNELLQKNPRRTRPCSSRPRCCWHAASPTRRNRCSRMCWRWTRVPTMPVRCCCAWPWPASSSMSRPSSSRRSRRPRPRTPEPFHAGPAGAGQAGQGARPGAAAAQADAQLPAAAAPGSGAHQQLGELAEAENLLNQALKLAPEDLALRRQFAGCSCSAARRPRRWRRCALLEAGKADAETLLLAGKAQLMQGNFEAADQAFGAAAKLRPDDAKTAAALALSAIVRDAAAPAAPTAPRPTPPSPSCARSPPRTAAATTT
jgi:tetratricopeptide (TPR) repeat protein